jgi:hypothetical protein
MKNTAHMVEKNKAVISTFALFVGDHVEVK